MKCFIDGKPIDPKTVTYREIGSGGIPFHSLHSLRIDLEGDELLALLGEEYSKLVEELRQDIANTGGARDAEQAALNDPSLDELLRNAPGSLAPLLKVYFWGDLAERLFANRRESDWEYVADELQTAFVGETCRIVATAYPVRPFVSEGGTP